MKEKRYVGIDPSTKTGLVILSEDLMVLHAEEIKSGHKTDPIRMLDFVKKIKGHLVESTDEIVIEGFSYNSTGKSVDFQYGLGWLIRCMLHEGGYKWKEVSPKTVKKFVTGNGNSNKESMIKSTKDNWGVEFLSKRGRANDNITDAYGMARFAYTMNHEEEFEKLNNKQKEAIITFLKIDSTSKRGGVDYE